MAFRGLVLGNCTILGILEGFGWFKKEFSNNKDVLSLSEDTVRLLKEPESIWMAGRKRGRPKARRVEVETFIGDEIVAFLQKRLAQCPSLISD